MGCSASKASTRPSQRPESLLPKPGGVESSHRPAENFRVATSICRFCNKKISEAEMNSHSTRCDAREVTCTNPWCQIVLKQGELKHHWDECTKKQPAICPKCGIEVLAVKLSEHRDICEPILCLTCKDKCIPRIQKWCPKSFAPLENSPKGPFATRRTEKRPEDGNNTSLKEHGKIDEARMKSLWGWMKCKMVLEDAIFRAIHKEMDLKKEGFAIFKAHDKDDRKSLAPKKSRSVLNRSHVPPAMLDHYFPTNQNTPITAEHVTRLINDIRARTLLPYGAAWRVFQEAKAHLMSLNTVVKINPLVGARHVNGRLKEGSRVIVVGDIHGHIDDLLHILDQNDLPNEGNYYVFNGDFVDRGDCGIEVLLVLFSLLLAFPKYVTLNRGNHECDYMNEEYGFDVEACTKYDRQLFRLIQGCFCALPLATMIGTKIFVVHGGLPRLKGVTIADIEKLERGRQIPMPDITQPDSDTLFQDLLWSDPAEGMTGWCLSNRGVGIQFGSDITEDFIATNNLACVVRSHEECAKGYKQEHNQKLITVFSASCYSDVGNNFGAVCVFHGDDTKPTFQTYHNFTDEIENMVDINDSFALASPIANKSINFSSTFTMSTPLNCGHLRRVKFDVLRELRERIYQRRHRLLSHFSQLDRSCKGSVWLNEWVEVMRSSLNLDIPWYFIRSYLVKIDEDSRICYSPFVLGFHNELQNLWLSSWRNSALAMLKNRIASLGNGNPLALGTDKVTVTYNQFCSAIAMMNYALTDNQLFQLFESFDQEGRGVISGDIFTQTLMSVPPARTHIPEWDFDVMDQFQNVIIQARTQLSNLFCVTASDKILTFERYKAGMDQLKRGMRNPLNDNQITQIFNFLTEKSGKGKLTFDVFLLSVSVLDLQHEANLMK